MDGMWYRHCPHCGEYINKSDPENSWACARCGWQEPHTTYFCEFVHKYCPFSQLTEEEIRHRANL